MSSISIRGQVWRIFIILLFLSFDLSGQSPIITYPIAESYEVSQFFPSGIEEKLYVGNENVVPHDFRFNADGTKIFVVDSHERLIVEYNLTTPYDVSSAQYAGPGAELIVRDEISRAISLFFNPEGTKMFVLGSGGKSVVEYNLTTAYDVSSAIYAGAEEEFDVSNRFNVPNGLHFSPDGSRMYVIGSNVSEKKIVEYQLSTAYDISTSNYSATLDVIIPLVNIALNLRFNADGTKMYVLSSDGYIVKYNLSTGYSISTATHSGEEGLYVRNDERFAQSFSFNPDGTKMYVIGVFDRVIVEYDLANIIDYEENNTDIVVDVDAHDGQGGANDISVAYSLEGTDAPHFTVNTSGQVTFNNAPNYESPLDANSDNAYSFFVVATTDAGTVKQPLVVNIQDLNDTPMFTSVGKGFDISSAVYTGASEDLYVGNVVSDLQELVFNSDGTKLFILGYHGRIASYDLSIPYDLSTAVFVDDFLMGNEVFNVVDFNFNDDGTKMFVQESTLPNKMVFYDLSVAYDVSTITYSGYISLVSRVGLESSTKGSTFNADGTKMYLTESLDDYLEVFYLSTPYDLSTTEYAGSNEILYLENHTESPGDITFSPDGAKMFIIGADLDAILAYDLTEPYNISTAVYEGSKERFYVGNEEKHATGLTFNSNGTKMFIVGDESPLLFDYHHYVHQYNLASSIDYVENGTDPIINIDANDGAGGADDVSVTYSLEGMDAALFSIDASGEVLFNTPPNFDYPQDTDLDNVYEFSVVTENTTDRSSQRIQVSIQNINDTPIFTSVGRGYDLSTAIYSGPSEELYVGNLEESPSGLTFSDNGSKLYTAGKEPDRTRVDGYSLSRPFDISTATNFGSIRSTGSARMDGLAIDPNGQRLITLSHSIIYYYFLHSPFDLSSAVFQETLTVNDRVEGASGLTFDPSGTKLFVIGSENKIIVQYGIEEYDIRDAFYENGRFLGDEISRPSDLTFSADGRKLFVVDSDEGAIVEYNLRVAYSLSTSIVLGDERKFYVGDQEASPSDLVFNPDGTKMFVLGEDDDAIVEYTLASSVNYKEKSTRLVINIDANDGMGGFKDTSVNYSLEGADASLFTIDASGIINFIAPPEFDFPQDMNQDNLYEFTVVAANDIDRSLQRIAVSVVSIKRPLSSNDLPDAAVDFQIFPNPAGNTLKIQGDSPSINQIRISDMSGRFVLRRMSLLDSTIDVSHLPAGIYLLKVESDGLGRTLKFTKE